MKINITMEQASIILRALETVTVGGEKEWIDEGGTKAEFKAAIDVSQKIRAQHRSAEEERP